MKFSRITGGIAIAAVAVLSFAGAASATGDDGWACPQGTTFNYKVEPLSGKTFTVPTPPSGWTVTGVVLKVGGPGGGSHIAFTPASPGQVLSVAYQQYDISHAHVCKKQGSTTTTTTTTTMPATTTTVTTVPDTTTTTTQPLCVDCVPNTVVVVPTTTTTLPPDAPTTTTAVAVADPPVPNPTDPTVPVTTQPDPAQQMLPPTGAGTTIAAVALCAMIIGIVFVLVTRKPKVH